MSLQQLPLHHLHKQLGATFMQFGPYQIPERYGASSTVEHLQTRQAAGLFDISHKSQILIQGQDACALLSRICPLDAHTLPVGDAKYTFFLNTAAGIVDHLVIMRLSENCFNLVLNGSRLNQDVSHINKYAEGLDIEIHRLDNALIALQGPQTDEVLKSIGLHTSHLHSMNCCKTEEGYFVCRSGYTGENGIEISLPTKAAHDLILKLLEDNRVTLSGHGARNTLRLEAGYCRYGNDLDESITPIEAGLLKVISKQVLRSGHFVGGPALKRKLSHTRRLTRMGLTPRTKIELQENAPILNSSEEKIGFVSSTAHGPSVGGHIAMGYVHPNTVEFGLPIFAFQEGCKIPLARKKLPFLPAATHRR